jgi:hypothetical protein
MLFGEIEADLSKEVCDVEESLVMRFMQQRVF